VTAIVVAAAVLAAVGLDASTRALVSAHRSRRVRRRLHAAGRRAGPPLGAGVLAWWARRRASGRELESLPDVVDALASALRSGHAPGPALAAAASVAPAGLASHLGAAAEATGRGVPLADAVDRWAASSDLDGVALVAAAVSVTARAGGEAGRSLASVADTLRERRALRREVRALSAQARLSATVLAVAPLAFAVVSAGIDPAGARFLLGTPLGIACLLGGAVLDAAGWVWMRRITDDPR
jgi:tight adherence protein B